jgi:hypothetical protein
MKRFLAIGLILSVVAGVARAQQPQPAQGVQAWPFDGTRRYVASSKDNTPYQVDVLRVNSTVAQVPDCLSSTSWTVTASSSSWDKRIPDPFESISGNRSEPLQRRLASVGPGLSRENPALRG